MKANDPVHFIYSWSNRRHIVNLDYRFEPIRGDCTLGHSSLPYDERRQIKQGTALCGTYGDSVPFDHNKARTVTPDCKNCAKLAHRLMLAMPEGVTFGE
jgi:hypothetical protein